MLKAVLETLDGLDAKYHDLYEEKDGKFNLKPIEGLRPEIEVTRLTTALGKERNDHKDTKVKLGAFGGLDPKEVQDKLDMIPELEVKAAGAVDEKKLQELADTRAQRLLAPVQRELVTATAKVVELTGQVDVFKKRETTRTVTDEIRSAAIKAKVAPEAIEDALLLGERVFEVAEDGAVVTRDNVGLTPGLRPDAWLADLLPRKPHWFGPTSGGGARSGGGAVITGPNPFSNDGWNMTQQGQLMKTDRAKAERLAKAAGTTIGGPRPAK